MFSRLWLGLALAGLSLLAGTAKAQDAATFELVAEITWSEETAPLAYPSGAHMSRLLGVSHNSRYLLFRDGHTASSGLELLAENGRIGVLTAEFGEAQRRNRIGAVIEEPGLSSLPSAFQTRFTTTEEHPLLSLATMIAPSPDWFTGVADLDLRQDDQWIEEIEMPLWAWDAGTDHGATYEARNDDTQPRQSVRLLASPHFLRPFGLLPVGTLKITRIDP